MYAKYLIMTLSNVSNYSGWIDTARSREICLSLPTHFKATAAINLTAKCQLGQANIQPRNVAARRELSSSTETSAIFSARSATPHTWRLFRDSGTNSTISLSMFLSFFSVIYIHYLIDTASHLTSLAFFKWLIDTSMWKRQTILLHIIHQCSFTCRWRCRENAGSAHMYSALHCSKLRVCLMHSLTRNFIMLYQLQRARIA